MAETEPEWTQIEVGAHENAQSDRHHVGGTASVWTANSRNDLPADGEFTHCARAIMKFDSVLVCPKFDASDVVEDKGAV